MIRALIATGRAATPRWPALVLAPIALATLLGGCVTSGYHYREDNGGGYYYGTPSVEYRDITPYPYGDYGYYGPYRYAYPSPYGYRRYGHDPYGYRGYWYGPYGVGPYGPWRGYPYGDVPRHDSGQRRPRIVDPTPDRPRSPWRDFDELKRRQRTQSPPPIVTPAAPPVTRPVAPAPGSGLGERIRRAKERASGREDTP